MYIGAAYYPELWDSSELDNDIKKCHELGVNCLRIGEFAWSKMEPRENEYDFSWLKKIVDKLASANISVVMCTPTCTPPRWFLDKYPEVMQISDNGKRHSVSSRCHICKTSPLMRQKNREIVTRLAECFGEHKGIIGWQIDNELFPYDEGCFCPACVQAFRDCLESKYSSIEKLNSAWGMSRWSLEYKDFNAVLPPHSYEWRHPSLRTEWRAFQVKQIYSYIDEQAEILHKFTNAPIGTDMMPNNTMSYYDATKNLDVIQHNHYDTAENLINTVFDYNFLRPIKPRPFWVTETQVGWNGSEFADNGYRPEGNCYINTWLPIAMGAEANLYWLFRTPKNGHELAHGAIFSTSGRPYHVSNEIKRAADDIKKCEHLLENSKIVSKIALHYSSVAERNFKSAPIIKDFSYKKTLIKIHQALSHCNVDIIDTPHSLEGYTTLISPFLSTINEDTRKKILSWVEAGGRWIVGPMSDIMTDYTSKCDRSPFFFLEEAAGVYTKYQIPMPNDVFCAERSDGTTLEVSMCYDAFEPLGDTKSLAKYSYGEFNGYSAVTERKFGKGSIVLVGSMLSADGWCQLVQPKRILEASNNLQIVERTGEKNAIVILELENKKGSATLDGEYTDIITDKSLCGDIRIKPYSVLVLVKK